MARNRKSKRVGILGGTFNPVHLGHILIGVEALEHAALDKVLLIPCHRPPHKKSRPEASGAQRLEMLRLAVRGDARFAVEDLELARGGVSYAIDTVRHLRRQHPEWELHFIIGGDSLAELASWKEAGSLVRLCRFVVVGRPGAEAESGASVGRVSRELPGGESLQYVSGRGLRVSSSEIRQRLAAGKSIRYLVTPAVVRYIERNGLYASNGNTEIRSGAYQR